MVNRSVLFAMANRLHYRGGMPRSEALSLAWQLARAERPEYTKARGVACPDRQQVLARLSRRGLWGIAARLEREPQNPYDPRAVRLVLVHTATGRTFCAGYLSRERAAALAPLLDAGLAVRVELAGVTGGPARDRYRKYGLNFAYLVAGVA